MRRALFVLLVLALAASASARETVYDLSIQEAVESDLGREKLYDVPFYFHGQEHPPVERRITKERTDRSSHGVIRDDRSGCRVAFLSAIRFLQNRAVEQGADAIIEIRSVTMDRELESSTEYRCIAGTTIVRVGLQGVLVKLED